MRKDSSNILVRKTMTKKAYAEFVKRNRSMVGFGKNLGTRTMGSARDRKTQDRSVAKMIRSGVWE